MWFFRIFYFICIFLVFFFVKETNTLTLPLVVIYSICIFIISFGLEILLRFIKIEKLISILISILIFLVIGFLINNIYPHLRELTIIRTCLLAIFVYMGICIGNRSSFFIRKFFRMSVIKPQEYFTPLKILDSSTIIDGRILDIVNTGFLEGKIIIPNFILNELQAISDSRDHLKRQKGRRGLEIVKKLQAQDRIPVEICNAELKNNAEPVDEKLVELAKQLSAVIITTDYNLLKIAEIQDIRVLNINGLATAVKQTILPGEELTIAVIREGKERDQGVGYIDDGSMVVIENGKKYIGETIPIEVTSLLQSDTGRIIFGRPKR